jgi:hypothetical protein
MSLEADPNEGIVKRWFPDDSDKIKAYGLRYISSASLLMSLVVLCTSLFMNGKFVDQTVV